MSRRTAVAGRDEGRVDVRLDGGSPLTTRHRPRLVLEGRSAGARTSSTRDSLRVPFQVSTPVLSLSAAHAGGQVLVPVAPRLTHRQIASWRDKQAAAEHRRLGPIARSSPWRQPHRTFRVRPPGRTNYEPLARDGDASTWPTNATVRSVCGGGAGMEDERLTVWIERTRGSDTVRGLDGGRQKS